MELIIQMIKSLMKIISDNIRILRIERGLTQEQLADILEISPSYVYRIEAGQRNISLKTLLILIWKFDIPPEKIIPCPQIKIDKKWEYEFFSLIKYCDEQQINFILSHLKHLISEMQEYFSK